MCEDFHVCGVMFHPLPNMAVRTHHHVTVVHCLNTSNKTTIINKIDLYLNISQSVSQSVSQSIS